MHDAQSLIPSISQPLLAKLLAPVIAVMPDGPKAWKSCHKSEVVGTGLSEISQVTSIHRSIVEVDPADAHGPHCAWPSAQQRSWKHARTRVPCTSQ